MESSPLTQQARPQTWRPKVANLYDQLFKHDEDVVQSEGFWRELFVLKPDRASLEGRLKNYSPTDLLHLQHATQQLFARAVDCVKTGSAPSDEVALDTLTVFLGCVLEKRFTNPSADVITVLAGLDSLDAKFHDFANAIETIIRSGSSLNIRKRAIDVALSLVSGAYQTSLVSYLTYRDLFPSLMKYVQDCEIDADAFEPFLLLGLLANYNKFEFRNPYRTRLEDFVNDSTIQQLVKGLGATCTQSRDRYVTLAEDVDEGWSLSGTLNYIGLGILARNKKVSQGPVIEEGKDYLAILPGPEAAILLATYDFANANKLFCSSLISCRPPSVQQESPFSSFLSLTSYILHHAHRSARGTLYAHLNLLTLRVIIEDPTLCKQLFSQDDILFVRLCRQRPPFLPSTSSPRPAAAQILDITIDTLTHNLRRRLEIPLYIASIHLIHRLLCYLAQTRTQFAYHWSLLWQTLLSLLRFLTIYASDLTSQSTDITLLLNPFILILALSVTAGEAFLPDGAAYNDLIYKLIEGGEMLSKFKSTYPQTYSSSNPPINILIAVSEHYQTLLKAERANGQLSKNASPREVTKVIRAGYETLMLPPADGLERWDRWREGNEKGLLKRVARLACEDARRIVRER